MGSERISSNDGVHQKAIDQTPAGGEPTAQASRQPGLERADFHGLADVTGERGDVTFSAPGRVPVDGDSVRSGATATATATVDERIAGIRTPQDAKLALVCISTMTPEAVWPAKLLDVANRLGNLFRSSDPAAQGVERMEAYGLLIEHTHEAFYLSKQPKLEGFAEVYEAAAELSKYLPQRDDGSRSNALRRFITFRAMGSEKLAIPANAMLAAVAGESDAARGGTFLFLTDVTEAFPKSQRAPLRQTLEVHLDKCPTSGDGALARRILASMER